jgi:uncharacterized membrane protein
MYRAKYGGERRWQECASVPRLQAHMTLFYITIPLMIAAVAIAVVPVLVGSFRHDRALERGHFETAESVAQESDFWHHMLGHRKVEGYAPTPNLVEDAEVLRVVPADRMVSNEPTVWAVSQRN